MASLSVVRISRAASATVQSGVHDNASDVAREFRYELLMDALAGGVVVDSAGG